MTERMAQGVSKALRESREPTNLAKELPFPQPQAGAQVPDEDGALLRELPFIRTPCPWNLNRYAILRSLRFSPNTFWARISTYKLQMKKQVPLLRSTEGSDISHAAHNSQCPDPQSLPSTAFLPKLPFSAPIQTPRPASPESTERVSDSWNNHYPHAMSPIPVEPALCPLPPTLPWPLTHPFFSWHHQLFSTPSLATLQPTSPRGFLLPLHLSPPCFSCWN